MLTNTAPAELQDHTSAVTATSIAVEAAEQRRHAALREVDWLVDSGQISAALASDLEADVNARLIAHVRALELYGEDVIDQELWARYVQLAARRCAAALADRRRSPRLRGLSARTRAVRERQMCVVASGRVSTDLLRLLRPDADEETFAMRGELAAAGLL